MSESRPPILPPDYPLMDEEDKLILDSLDEAMGKLELKEYYEVLMIIENIRTLIMIGLFNKMRSNGGDRSDLQAFRERAVKSIWNAIKRSRIENDTDPVVATERSPTSGIEDKKI